MSEKYKALVVDQKDGQQTAEVRDLDSSQLPAGDVTVAVEYSTLNYKDGLAVTGSGKIIRQFPMVAGIDFAGTVVESSDSNWKPGDRVVATGWGLGERYPGGYAQRQRVRGEWLVRVPENLTTRQAMGIGTAGFTAMLCVMALEHAGLRPGDGEVLVTGAGGGVGSVAIALLAKLGHHVVASTGRAETHDYLRALGAKDVIDRRLLSEPSKKPFEAERWAGAVDSVGGVTLANVIRAMKYGCSVAACGLAGGSDLNATVFPFILRAVNLLGVDSAYCRMPKRTEAWRRLSVDLPLPLLNEMMQDISLSDVPKASEEILAGKVRGRTVVDVRKVY
ncbi:MAG: oxidoreductase [Acidobacteriaceae bacterium]|nr:oxidoreductase [Acidobacteriaceae bacterium]